MRFLIDADMPRSLADMIRRRGHEAVDVRDVGPSLALDTDIALYARAERLCIVTGDFGFADIRTYASSGTAPGRCGPCGAVDNNHHSL